MPVNLCPIMQSECVKSSCAWFVNDNCFTHSLVSKINKSGLKRQYGTLNALPSGTLPNSPFADNVRNIVTDLNEVCGTEYKPTTKKTQDLIKARFNEGFTVDDFKKVHRNMMSKWGSDDNMVPYLRPITLYGTKFEGYLNVVSTTITDVEF